jgi:hypothetical protein
MDIRLFLSFKLKQNVFVNNTSNQSKRNIIVWKISFGFVFLFKNESRLNGQQGQYLVATTNQAGGDTNGNQTTGRVIIAKAHPPNQNSQINQNSNNISGPV